MGRARIQQAAVALGIGVSAASAAFPLLADPLVLPALAEAATSPASRYANLSNEAALAELQRRRIAFEPAQDAPGVRTPIRLIGKLHGVWVHSSLPEEERRTSLFEILDARLALALDDFAGVLSNHDVVEVIHFTMYRPSDDAREAAPTGRARHPGGMAIDVGALRKRSGALLTVATDWPASIGSRTCGEGARRLPARRGRELMSLVCEARDLRLFHVILTPHFNVAHHDHLHLEIKPDTPWFLVE
jgi:hypothetical protein